MAVEEVAEAAVVVDSEEDVTVEEAAVVATINAMSAVCVVILRATAVSGRHGNDAG